MSIFGISASGRPTGITTEVVRAVLEATGEPDLTGEFDKDDTQSKEDGEDAPPTGLAGRLKQIIRMVDTLLASEQDEGKKRTLGQIRGIAQGAMNEAQKDEESGADEPPTWTVQTGGDEPDQHAD